MLLFLCFVRVLCAFQVIEKASQRMYFCAAFLDPKEKEFLVKCAYIMQCLLDVDFSLRFCGNSQWTSTSAFKPTSLCSYHNSHDAAVSFPFLVGS